MLGCCGSSGIEHTSLPIRPPMASLPEPIVWFQLPSERLGSFLVTAPEEEAEKPPTETPAWDTSCSSSAFSFFASPAF